MRREKIESRRATRVALEKFKTLSHLYVDAQKEVNAYVRARDAGKGCISCSTGQVEQAGHFFPIGSKWRCHPLRLDVRLIHGQCVQCNHSAAGNVHGYIAGIVERFGRGHLEDLYAIKRKAEHGEYPLLTKDQVRAMAADWRRLARETRKAA